jgi:hypothetical protein
LQVRERVREVDRRDVAIGGHLLNVALPSDADDATRALVERLVEVSESLAVRCAQLQEALDSRVVIEQAKGVLSERLGVAPDDAFVVLRRAARSNRIRIHDLARRVVASRATPRELVPYV